MQEEKIAIVNEKDKIIGAKAISKVHELGLLHREVYVYLINLDGKILLQKRNDNGLFDHSAAGHFSNEESYIEGAIREFKEELGVKLSENDLHEIGYERIETRKPNKKNIRFVKIYIVRKNIKNFKIDKTELNCIKFFSKSELKTLLQQPKLLTGSAKLIIEKYILKEIL